MPNESVRLSVLLLGRLRRSVSLNSQGFFVLYDFNANRIAAIQELTTEMEWNHIHPECLIALVCCCGQFKWIQGTEGGKTRV